MKFFNGCGKSIAIIWICVYFVSCSSRHSLSDYMEMPKEMVEGKYFKMEYLSPEANFSRYRKFKIHPISFQYLKGRDKFSREELSKISRRFHQEFVTKFSRSFEILDSSDAIDRQTLVLRPVLVKLTSPKRFLNFILSMLIFVPHTRGSAAIEAKLIDGASGILVAEVAEQQIRGKEIELFASGDYARLTHAYIAFNEWSVKMYDFVTDPEYA